MQYRRIGRSGLVVSTIGLGSWLTYGMNTSQDQSRTCIETAYDAGITFFDTANAYNGGQTEQVVGDVLQAYPRDTYVLATKVFFPMGDKPTQRGLSRKHIMEQCHASLRRLKTDYIDLYQCHRPDPSVPLDETLRALDDLIRQGKVLYAGVSEWPAPLLQRAVGMADSKGWDRIISHQPIYNMLVRYIENEVLPMSRHEGIGQVVFSPLAQGILTGKYSDLNALPERSRAQQRNANTWIQSYLKPEVIDVVQRLGTLAREQSLTLSQMAIAWVLRDEVVASAIIGASRPQQIEENVAASDVVLSDEVLTKIEDILEPIRAFKPLW